MAVRTAQGTPISWKPSLNCSAPSTSPFASRSYRCGWAWARACVLCGGRIKHLQITNHPLCSTHGPPSDPAPSASAGSVDNTHSVGNSGILCYCYGYGASVSQFLACWETNGITSFCFRRWKEVVAWHTGLKVSKQGIVKKWCLVLVLCSKPGNINSPLPFCHLL